MALIHLNKLFYFWVNLNGKSDITLGSVDIAPCGEMWQFLQFPFFVLLLPQTFMISNICKYPPIRTALPQNSVTTEQLHFKYKKKISLNSTKHTIYSEILIQNFRTQHIWINLFFKDEKRLPIRKGKFKCSFYRKLKELTRHW